MASRSTVVLRLWWKVGCVRVVETSKLPCHKQDYQEKADGDVDSHP